MKKLKTKEERIQAAAEKRERKNKRRLKEMMAGGWNVRRHWTFSHSIGFAVLDIGAVP